MDKTILMARHFIITILKVNRITRQKYTSKYRI